jgi:hypothetical protein
MRTLLLGLLAALGLSAAGCASHSAHGSSSDCCSATGMYRHVVLFKFKDSSTKEQVASVEAAFRKLATQVDTVRGFEWGTNVSPEGKADGFTHCFLVTFDNRAGLDVYLPHPAHKAFIDVLRPHLDKVLVVDYVAQK